jgi:H+/gluconate symporter-like permease
MPRFVLRLLPLALLLALPGVASAQAELPPPISDIKNGKPWTYQFGKMILAAALALLAAIVVGYLVKARDFRTNQRRGGSK